MFHLLLRSWCRKNLSCSQSHSKRKYKSEMTKGWKAIIIYQLPHLISCIFSVIKLHIFSVNKLQSKTSYTNNLHKYMLLWDCVCVAGTTRPREKWVVCNLRKRLMNFWAWVNSEPGQSILQYVFKVIISRLLQSLSRCRGFVLAVFGGRRKRYSSHNKVFEEDPLLTT